MPLSRVALPVVAAAALALAPAAVPRPGPGPALGPGPAVAGPPATAVAARWTWPLAGPPAVLRAFEDVGRYEAGHRGADLAARPGGAVLSPDDGVVTFAGPVAGRVVVVVAHPGGLRSTLEPVAAPVPAGTAVRAGQRVADVPAPGAPGSAHCLVPCLHLGARDGERYLDPLALLAPAGPPVLLPLGAPGGGPSGGLSGRR
ncbi:peptidoglycan DD-metalloendopeptidase family protein [Kineococcus sp. SYSU DK004]|uniref:peptidoglycan DD-metalloendopeptidase family protein n=1 Tax=Kineococcus sp. SYSU DK004 TaxID=3383125 RepID=UPI003D7D1AFD